MPRDSHETLSRWLSWALRHDPVGAGIVLDTEGWADTALVIVAARAQGIAVDASVLAQAVQSNAKQRFALSADGLRMRANQGHSVAVDLGLIAVEPPAVLYHGTADRFVAAIRRTGLTPRSRQHVHLSAELTTAVAVGARHGRPVVLRIDAQRMHAAGLEFFRAQNGVWLTHRVPPEFLGENEDSAETDSHA